MVVLNPRPIGLQKALVDEVLLLLWRLPAVFIVQVENTRLLSFLKLLRNYLYLLLFYQSV